MGQIPVYESTQDVRVGGIDVYANPNAFGAQIGAALKDMGGNISQLAGSLKAKQKKEEAERRQARNTVNVANTSIAFAKTAADIESTAPADGTGTMEATLLKQQELIQTQAAKIKDPIERQDFVNTMTERLAPYAQKGIAFEQQSKAKLQYDSTNFALNGLQNQVRADSTYYDTAVKDGIAMIDANVGSNMDKDQLKMSLTNKLSYARFQGMLETAKTPEAYDIIRNELSNPENKWNEKLDDQTFNTLLNDIDQSKKVFRSQLATNTRSLLDSIDARTKDLVAISPAEMQQATEMAITSGDPILIKRAHRGQRDIQIMEQNRNQDANTLEKRAHDITAGGYPGMPEEVNTSIREAQQLFPGIPASFYGGTAIQEYGKYLPRGKTKIGDGKYAPRAIGNADFHGVRPEAMNAATLAGEIFGEPLQTISAHRSQTRQNMIRFGRGDPNRPGVAKHSQHTEGDAFDFNTVGWSETKKAKLVDSLIQAGFTNFGSYGTHIHADMRPLTPKTFDAKSGWMGWSHGSPEVIAAMEARGYGANMAGSQLNTGGGAVRSTATKVDYSRGTDNGSSSATGLMQQTTGTWLASVNDPAIAARIGLPPGLSNDQKLELRKDPRWAILVTGAQAEQNKKVLEATLGRPVTDSELYMAHFMGVAGAQQFIAAYINSPDAKAADLMPQAAKNNPGKFYADGGKGEALSVKDAYDQLNVQFSTAPSQIQYEDAQTYSRMATAARKGQKDDPMGWYGDHNTELNDLQAEGGFAARGAMASAAAGLYGIPIAEMKPFASSEMEQYQKVFSDGDISTKLELMKNIDLMDKSSPGMAAAAYAQLGMKDTAVAHAASLANERGDTATAEMIVRGADRLKQDKSYEASLFGADGQNARQTFDQTTGGALFGIPPESRNAIYNAAKDLYAEQSARQGNMTFDADAFAKAVVQVTGGGTSTPGIGDINGTSTVLPPGITEDTFKSALENMTDSDLIKFSEDGMPPVDVSGDPISASAIQDEGEFVFIGGTQYRVRMADDTFLVTGERIGNNNLKAFVFDADPKALSELAARPGVVHVQGRQDSMNTWQAPVGSKDASSDASAWDLPLGAQ